MTGARDAGVGGCGEGEGDPEVGAIILAGGHSRRMGRDKALLRLAEGGPRLIERSMLAARPVAGRVVISANTPERFGWLDAPVVADRFPGAGPLAGLEAGLTWLGEGCVLLLGCDMPFVASDVLRLLVARQRATGAAAVVPLNAEGAPEPLCAVYTPRCLPIIRERLARGARRMCDWLPLAHAHFVAADDLRRLDPALRTFRNLNTPEELDQVAGWG